MKLEYLVIYCCAERVGGTAVRSWFLVVKQLFLYQWHKTFLFSISLLCSAALQVIRGRMEQWGFALPLPSPWYHGNTDHQIYARLLCLLWSLCVYQLFNFPLASKNTGRLSSGFIAGTGLLRPGVYS